MQIKLLCIGDVVGRPGRSILADQLPLLVKQHEIDCVIANAENVSGGSGLTTAAYEKLLKYGVNLITMGDHLYRKREIIDVLHKSDCIVRPANLMPQAAGKEWAVHTTGKGAEVAVITVLGRMYMSVQADNPFLALDRVLKKVPASAKIVVVDMHAEATSEKIAMGWYLDGRVSLVFGTHTHVTTADETVLPKGTAYITDLGMTGPHESVLGRSVEPVLKSLLTNMPYAYSIAVDDARLNAIVVTVDSHTGQASAIERICLRGGNREPNSYEQADGRPDYGSNAQF